MTYGAAASASSKMGVPISEIGDGANYKAGTAEINSAYAGGQAT